MGENRRLRRRPPQRGPKRRILIVCEGTVTEQGYFDHLGIAARSALEIVVLSGGTPKTLVERALRLKREAEQEAKSKRDDFLRYDEVWCVHDVDEHPLLPEARPQAKDTGIRLAISNPCFELWVLLPFQDQRKHLHRKEVQKLCRQHLPGYKKSLPFARLWEHYKEAVARSKTLEEWHSKRATKGANPSTQVHHLTERIKAAGGWSFGKW